MTYVAEWNVVETDNSDDDLAAGTVVTYEYNDNYQPLTETPFLRLEFDEPPYGPPTNPSMVNATVEAVSATYQNSGPTAIKSLLINRPPRLVPFLVTIQNTSTATVYRTITLFDERPLTCVYGVLGTPSPGDTLDVTSEIVSGNRLRLRFNRPPNGWSIGTYRRTIRVQDEHGEWSTEITVTLNVIEDPNNPPVPAPDINFGCSFLGCEIDATAHFTDPEGDELGNWTLTYEGLLLGATIHNDTGLITVPQNVPLGVYPIEVSCKEVDTAGMLTGTSSGWTITIENPHQLKKPAGLSLRLDPETN